VERAKKMLIKEKFADDVYLIRALSDLYY